MLVAQKIEPLNIHSLSYDDNRKIERKLVRILEEWEGTPHRAGQQCKGVAVDCVRFVTAVADELYGVKHEIARLPQDISFHQKDTCMNALKRFLVMYPHVDVENGILQPGDVLITGPLGGGPGHAVIAGVKYLWHCDSYRVVRTGLSLTNGGVYFLKKTFRGLNRERWLQCL